MKVIKGEECVKQHGLVVCDMEIGGVRKNDTKRVKVEKVKVWRLKDSAVAGKFRESLKLQETDTWEEGKDEMLNVAKKVCGMASGRGKRKLKWWWTEEVRVAVDEKRKRYHIWSKAKGEVEEAAKKAMYHVAKKACRKVIGRSQQSKRDEIKSELEGRGKFEKLFKMAKKLKSDSKDVEQIACMRDEAGQLVIEEGQVQTVWKRYVEKLLNEENEWTNDLCKDVVEGPMMEFKTDEVGQAMQQAKRGKAGGPTGLVVEILEAAGEKGLKWMVEVCNEALRKGVVPEDWKSSILVPLFKGKGDAMDCGSYRGLKLLEHAMKVWERLLERRLRDKIVLSEGQFGFVKGRGTIDAISIIRRIQDRYLEKGKTLYMAFVDLEKAFDRVPREVVVWALRKRGIEEVLVRAVMASYDGARTKVRVAGGTSEEFGVGVGVHQGAVLSPLLFVNVLDVVSENIRRGLPWELLYADDLVIVAETEEELKERLTVWKDCLEGKGLKVNMGKTKVMKCSSGRRGSMKNLKGGHVQCARRV